MYQLSIILAVCDSVSFIMKPLLINICIGLLILSWPCFHVLQYVSFMYKVRDCGIFVKLEALASSIQEVTRVLSHYNDVCDEGTRFLFDQDVEKLH